MSKEQLLRLADEWDERASDGSNEYRAGMKHAYQRCAEQLRTIASSVEGQAEDAARYLKLRAMCCGEGPTDALATAWMTGDETAADAAIDAARAAQQESKS